MSAFLRVGRLDIAAWGRASGFGLDLSAGNFLVLFGPNESGKSSAATALAWLIAGPGTQGVLQRFGANKEILRARLQGFLGSDDLTVEVSATVTGQRPGTDAREYFNAKIGDTYLTREELTRRLGGGDFTGYRRHYWVEALNVADGDDLQENVSVRAMFGGVDPFAEAGGMDVRARALLGAPRGVAAAGSARALHDQMKALDRELVRLPDTKSQWTVIDGEMVGKTARLEAVRPEIDELNAEMRSVGLAASVFRDGSVGARDVARQTLATTPVPSSAERRVHERATLARSKIGVLLAAEGQKNSALEQHEAAEAVLDEDWRVLVGGRSLGETGISEVRAAEAHLEVCGGDLASAREDVARAEIADKSAQERYGELSTEWRHHAPETLSPEECLSVAAKSTQSVGPPQAADRVVLSGADGATSARRKRFVALFLGTAALMAVTALAALQGNWVAVALTGIGAVVLARLVVNLLRSRFLPDEVPDAAIVDLADRLVEARRERDQTSRRLAEARGTAAHQGQRMEQARDEYQRRLGALGVPVELAQKFEQAAVDHLVAVRSAQLAAAALERARSIESARLDEVRGLFVGAVDGADIEPPEESLLIASQPAGPETGDNPTVSASIPLAGPRDAAEAESMLDAICQRVDIHNDMVVASREAEDALNRAVEFDKVALSLIDVMNPEGLQARHRELESGRDELDEERETTEDLIAELAAEKKRIEAPDSQRIEMLLRRSELLAQVENKVVLGLGHYLVARLLRDAAEEHRRTKQPGLLRRTQEMARDVADDWRGVTVNPDASATSAASGDGDKLLVDSTRGEYSAQRLSFGAQSLLYLTLRLATIEEQSKTRGVRLPLLLDDVLVGLDDERAERCVQLLADYSENHQLLLLTCHRRTAERAQSAGAELLAIPPS